MFRKIRHFLTDFIALARPYWTSEERASALGLLTLIIAINLGIVYVNVLFSNWYNRFYDALQAHDFARFVYELKYFCVLATAFIAMSVYQTYFNQMLMIRWRRWLTNRFLRTWLGERAFYNLQLGAYTTDNPDQRIADDLQLFVDASLSLSLGLLSSFVTLISFSTILWHLSGSLDLSWGGRQLAIPGYMLWAALVYSIAGTWITHWLGNPLTGLNFQQQRFEANFRYSLVRIRENAEAIALYAGERSETVYLNERFAEIVQNWWAIMKRQKKLTWFTSGYGQAAIVFPVLAAAPRYFSGAIQLGGLMQTMQAFGQVQGAMSWFVTAYVSLAQWKATVDRLTQFSSAMKTTRADAMHSGIVREFQSATDLAIRDLDLNLPDQRPLLSCVNLDLRPGESVLLSGDSGIGKSTLLRAVGGIWPFGKGRILIPQTGKILFLPQKPYLPSGTLRRVLSYPAFESFDDESARAALDACGLSFLADRLGDTENWSLQLSPGEQQRIGFVRVVLHAPDWLFLDEATSSLDEASESTLYRLVRERLPKTTIVSIGHRNTLAAVHDKRFEVNRFVAEAAIAEAATS